MEITHEYLSSRLAALREERVRRQTAVSRARAALTQASADLQVIDGAVQLAEEFEAAVRPAEKLEIVGEDGEVTEVESIELEEGGA